MQFTNCRNRNIVLLHSINVNFELMLKIFLIAKVKQYLVWDFDLK